MELIKKLKEKISIAFDNNCNVDDTDWGSQQGILITVKDAMLIVKHLELSNSHKQVVMQAEGSDVSEGAAVASEGQGEANMSADWKVKCNRCGKGFEKVTQLWSHLDRCRA